MIVTFEKSLDSYTKRSGLFGNEYVYEFIGPDIDMSKFNYISVVDCFIVCERETINNLVTLSSSIIDKSPGNPYQEIFKFCKSKKSSTFYEQPTHRDNYKMQCFSLNESVFTFTFLKEVKNIKVRFRLEFIKCHTDLARL